MNHWMSWFVLTRTVAHSAVATGISVVVIVSVPAIAVAPIASVTVALAVVAIAAVVLLFFVRTGRTDGRFFAGESCIDCRRRRRTLFRHGIAHDDRGPGSFLGGSAANDGYGPGRKFRRSDVS
jgi:hypothetical protein